MFTPQGYQEDSGWTAQRRRAEHQDQDNHDAAAQVLQPPLSPGVPTRPWHPRVPGGRGGGHLQREAPGAGETVAGSQETWSQGIYVIAGALSQAH